MLDKMSGAPGILSGIFILAEEDFNSYEF
jgi:hypothetical protein